jgi:alkylated DNA repair dioxygenase AlkB
VCAQLTLFSTDGGGPQGLRYRPDFISADEENELIDRIRELPLMPFQFGVYEGKRRVASFGWRYDYSHQRLERAEELPEWLSPFITRIEAFAQLGASAVGQVLCTEYEKGVGIGWHRDKPHFDTVFGLSLASACRFRFRRKSGSRWERFTLQAQPRSLYMMTGEARHIWEHSIPPVEAARYSITFRTMANPKRRSRLAEPAGAT